MRRKNKGVDPNMKFLFGSVVLFFLFVLIVGIFSYFTLQEFWHSDAPDAVKNTAAATPVHDYSIRFDKSFEDTNYTLYLNDDIIYKGEPVNTDTVIYARRKAAENSLIIVDNNTDIIKDIIELSLTGDIRLKLTDSTLSYTIE